MEASLSFAATDCGAMPSTVPFLDHMHGPKLTHIVFFGYYIMSDLKYLNICGWSWPFVIRLLLLFWGNLIGQTVFLLTSDKENKAAQHPGWCSAPVALTTVGLFKVQAEKIKKKQYVHRYLWWHWISRSSFVTEKLLVRPRKVGVRVTPCQGNWSAIKTPPDTSENIWKNKQQGMR